jgi:hypothetical protein
LKRIAYQYQIPVVVVNQLTASAVSPFFCDDDDGWKNIPALGLVWSHCVGVRIMLLRRESHACGVVDENEAKEGCVYGVMNKRVCIRHARILQSVNSVSDEEIKFVIEDRGVRLIL